MPVLTCVFQSDVLGHDTTISVVLPKRAGRDSPMPLLHLLHGAGGDHSSWLRKSSVARYADEAGIAVVMPTGSPGAWTDQVHGSRWWTFVDTELPAVVADLFALDPPRERTFAAGLSRGGYGALKLGLRHPERFAAVAGFSATVDIASEDWSEPWRRDAFGDADRARREGDDLFTLAEQIDPASCPRLFLSCGTEDRLLEQNRRFRELAASRGLPIEWLEQPGAHEWDVWDRDIRRLLPMLAAGA